MDVKFDFLIGINSLIAVVAEGLTWRVRLILSESHTFIPWTLLIRKLTTKSYAIVRVSVI